jgi:DDE domain
LRQCKYLNNLVEQDHRRIKRLVRPGLGFGSLQTAERTLAGFEAMAMIRKGQVQSIGGNDMQAQTAFVACLFNDVMMRPEIAGSYHLARLDPTFATQPHNEAVAVEFDFGEQVRAVGGGRDQLAKLW